MLLNHINSIPDIVKMQGKFLVNGNDAYEIGICVPIEPAETTERATEYEIELNGKGVLFPNKFKLFDFFNGKRLMDKAPKGADFPILEMPTETLPGKQVKPKVLRPDRVIQAGNTKFQLSTASSEDLAEVAKIQMEALRNIKKGDAESIAMAAEVTKAAKGFMSTVALELKARQDLGLL